MEPHSASASASVRLGLLRDSHGKVVSGCQEKIQHWKKVESDYEALQDRLNTLPDKLSYDIMVPFGPLAFMPGRLVHTNEVTVLLGDNWFAKCSAKQAGDLVEHRKKPTSPSTFLTLASNPVPRQELGYQDKS